MDEFRKLVDILESRPGEQCVVRREFLDEVGVDYQALANASGRTVRLTNEIVEAPERKMAFRDAVYVYSPKEAN